MTERVRALPERRKFLKAGGVAAVSLLVTEGAGAQPPAHGHSGGAPDRGLWITWYDLPDAGRNEYLSWLHGTHIPDLLKQPGYLWAAHYAATKGEVASTVKRTDDSSVGTGFNFILVFGAEGPHVFANPAPGAISARLGDDGKKMLAMRIGERMNIMSESGRCDGQAAKEYKGGLTGGPFIQVGSFNCPYQREEELHEGYLRIRMPSVCATPSCIRTRKLNSVAGWAKHIIFYEFMSSEGYWRDYPGAVERSPLGTTGTSMVPLLVHAPHSPNAAERIFPKI